MAAFVAAIQAILEIVRTARSIVDFVESNKNEAWFQESAKAFVELRAAVTPEEKRNAAKKIGAIFGSL